MYDCIVVHNMILKDKGKMICHFHETNLPTYQEGLNVNQDTLKELYCRKPHNNLRSDLVKHTTNFYMLLVISFIMMLFI